MIKVVHITASLGFGGVERVVTSLCDNMDHERFEMHIISLSDHTPLAAFLQNSKKIFIHTCGRPQSIGSFGLHFPSTFKMFRTLKSIRPHIIHSHLYHLNSLAYAFAQGIPHVITLHGPSMIALRNRARQLFFAAANAGRKNATYTITVSESVKHEIVQHFHSNYSTVEVIHNGIDTDLFRPLEDHDPKKKEIPVAINIARHVKAKGIESLLKAWKVVIAERKARLYLVGDGPQHENYKSLCSELGIDQWVIFYGARDDVHELMQESDLGIFPSETEGMPMAPAEMMAMELPVIASDIPPLVELIGPPEAGDVTPVNDPKALAAKILEYLNDPEMIKRKGMAARKRIISNFSLKQQVKRHETFYHKILTDA